MATTHYAKPQTISEAYGNKRYQGKIVIESPEGLYSTESDENAIKKYRQLRSKYSSSEVTTTVIPKGLMITTPFETS
jgi:DNA-binding transcriptional regulator YhcF (GntR family)